MPKQKTHKGVAKRFKVTGRGKVVRRKAGKSHLLSHKGSKRKRSLRQDVQVTGAGAKQIKHALGLR